MPEYICYCTKCFPKQVHTLKTIKEHLAKDKEALEHALAQADLSLHQPRPIHLLQKYIDLTQRSIDDAVSWERVKGLHLAEGKRLTSG